MASEFLTLRREVLALRRLFRVSIALIVLAILAGAAAETQLQDDVSVSGVLNCLGLKTQGSVEIDKDLLVKGEITNVALGKTLDELTGDLGRITTRLEIVERDRLQVETGTIIGDANVPGWTLNVGKGDRVWTRTVPFSRKFRDAPKIVFGLTHLDIGPAIGNHRLDVTATATNEWITVNIKTWDDSGVGGAIVPWMAVGLPELAVKQAQ